MTLDEFFTALEKTPRDWRIELLGGEQIIRRKDAFVTQCPLTAVAGFGSGDPSYCLDAAREIGLETEDTIKILNAADGRGTLRKRLIAACGLKEDNK